MDQLHEGFLISVSLGPFPFRRIWHKNLMNTWLKNHL